MRIWLAYKSHREGADDPFTSLLPVGLLSMNAVLREAGYDCLVANLSGIEIDDVIPRFISDSPAVIGLSQFTHNRIETLDLARALKKRLPGCFVLVGGPHATFRWREILESSPFVDAVAVGEGESTMLELVRAISGKALSLQGIPGLAVRGADGSAYLVAERQLLQNLDSIPEPGRYYDNFIGVNLRQQLEFIITSRGCPSSCNFCSSPGFWGRKLRFRSPASMVDEIRHLRDSFGLIYFSIRDDTFTTDKKRVIEFCRSLLRERIFILWNCQSRVNSVDSEMLAWMKRAGCECIQLGIESGSKPVLESLGKRISPSESESVAKLVHDAGIRLSIYLIAGTPEESDEDINATCRLISLMRPDDGQVSPLVYYPGTRLFEQGVESGAVSADLFEKARAPSCPVRSDANVVRTTNKYLKSLEASSVSAGFTSADFARQKTLLGYCHATNLMAGEFYAACGDEESALKEYNEIVLVDRDNPWGWLALGEYYGEIGRIHDAIKAFLKLCELLPAHEPGFRALGELFGIAGDKRRAKENMRQADLLINGS